jgi:hypothetical protein
MNASELIPFLGHSSIHQPFDDFLTSHGFTKRPKVGRRLDTLLSVDGTGIWLGFDFATSAIEKHMPIKSEGSFIFYELSVTFIIEEKKSGSYNGVLPYGISGADTRQSVEAKLGTPKRRNEDSDNYYLDGLVWTVGFQGERIQLVQISLPRDGFRKYGLCP